MTASSRWLIAGCTALCLLAAAGFGEAVTITYGVPIDGIGGSPLSPTGDFAFDGHSFSFYIPLSEDASGIFGVTDVTGGKAGTVSDDSDEDGGWLTMFLRFEGYDFPPAHASLFFGFKDLDLVLANDPDDLTEDVRFFDDAGTPFSDTIDSLADDTSDYSVFGNHTFQGIFFPDVTSLLVDSGPLDIELLFHSDFDDRGSNTLEFMKAKLITKPIPEPSTMVLIGLGLAGLVVRRRLSRR